MKVLMFKTPLLVILAVSTLSACTIAPYKVNLDTNQQEKLNNAQLVVDLSNKKLGAQYHLYGTSDGTLAAAGVTAGALGGLIVGLTEAAINESRETDAEEAITKIRELLAGDILKKAYEKQYQMLITTLPQLADNQVKVYDEWPSKGIKTLGLAPDDTALILTPEYSLTPDNTMLHVLLQVQLYQGAVKGAKPQLLYQNRFLYQSKSNPYVDRLRTEEEKQEYLAKINAKYAKLPDGMRERLREIKKRDKALAAVNEPLDEQAFAAKQAKTWLADNGQPLRQYLEEGVQEVFNMFAYDVAEQTDFTQGKVFPIAFRSFSNTSGERRWYRLGDNFSKGIMLSLNSNDFFRGTKTAQGQVIVAPLRQ